MSLLLLREVRVEGDDWQFLKHSAADLKVRGKARRSYLIYWKKIANKGNIRVRGPGLKHQVKPFAKCVLLLLLWCVFSI